MIGAALAAALLAGAPTTPEPRSLIYCGLDRAECPDGTPRQTLKRFRTTDAESLAAKGVEGVRVFTIDGHDRYLPLVGVLSRAGGPAMVEIGEPGAAPLPPTLAGGPAREAAAKLTALAVASRPFGGYDPQAICMHTWTFAIEVLGPDGVTERFRDTCAPDDLAAAAQALSLAAANNLAGCERLEPEPYYHIPAFILRACLQLGERRRGAAADVANSWNRSPLRDGSPLGIPPGDWLEPTAVLEWPGKPPARGREAVDRFWMTAADRDPEERGALMRPNTAFAGLLRVDARSDVRAWTTGEIMLDTTEGRKVAPFRQDWTRSADGRWRLARWTVGAFEARD